MTITALPTPPSINNSAQFAAQSDALLAALPNFVTQVNAVAVAMNLNSTTDTSTTSNVIGTGAKTFTVTAGKSFQPGMYLVIADTAAPSTNSMFGQITSYSSTSLVMNIISILGSGTKTAWNISQSAPATDLGGTISGAPDRPSPAGTDRLAVVVAGVLNSLSLTNLVTWLSGLCSAGWNAFTASTLNSGFVTIASAATPDIFAAASNTINYTGTATCTGFVAAAKAGMTRTLICAAGCTFTTGANLLIQGINSGTNLTLGANAVVEVVALSTTQFKMTYSYSGSFTGTFTGFTANPTPTCTFTHQNGVVTLYIPNSFNTSNATTFTMTGLPAGVAPPSNNSIGLILGENNGTIGIITASAGTLGTVTFGNGASSAAFTASGTKGVFDSVITYKYY